MPTETKILDLADVDSEKAVLGCLMSRRESFEEVLPLLEKSDFTLLAHQVVFSALRDAYESDAPIDGLVLRDALIRRGEYELTGGLEGLIELSESFGDTANAAYYAKNVADYALRRKLWRIGDWAWKASADVCTSTDHLLVSLHQQLELVASTGKGVAPERLEEVVSRLPAEWAKASGRGVTSGMRRVDGIMDGLSRPCYAILAARPSIGKTSMALDWLIAAARAGIPGLFITLEQSCKALAGRAVGVLTGQSIGRLIHHESPENREAACGAAALKLRELAAPIRVVGGLVRLAEISACVRKHTRRDGVKIVVVDYVQLIEGDSKTENRNQELTRISKSLRALANQCDCLLLVLCQLTREAAGVRPGLKMLRDSGSLEQDADAVMFLHPVNEAMWRIESEPLVDFIVGKQRDGQVGTVALRFNKPTFTFREADEAAQVGARQSEESAGADPF